MAQYLTIHYEPAECDPPMEVAGDKIRASRIKAGFTSQYHLAAVCLWSQSKQSIYERAGKRALPYSAVRKLIRACKMIIPYEPLEFDPPQLVEGAEIRALRLAAGFTSQWSIAEACGWKQKPQWKYERSGKHEMPLSAVLKLIKVCNGGHPVNPVFHAGHRSAFNTRENYGH